MTLALAFAIQALYAIFAALFYIAKLGKWGPRLDDLDELDIHLIFPVGILGEFVCLLLGIPIMIICDIAWVHWSLWPWVLLLMSISSLVSYIRSLRMILPILF